MEIFYSETRGLTGKYEEFREIISKEELSRAEILHSEEDRHTFVACHALLRLVIASRLNLLPSDIRFGKERCNKPVMLGNPLYFNLTHTREAFAFVISFHSPVGIDIEKISRKIDYRSVSGSCLSNRERMFVEEYPDKLTDRFFLLWTRKEAYLKCLGTGLYDNLRGVNSFDDESFIDHNYFESCYKDHYIYSKRISAYYVSIATPRRVEEISTNCLG